MTYTEYLLRLRTSLGQNQDHNSRSAAGRVRLGRDLFCQGLMLLPLCGLERGGRLPFHSHPIPRAQLRSACHV